MGKLCLQLSRGRDTRGLYFQNLDAFRMPTNWVEKSISYSLSIMFAFFKVCMTESGATPNLPCVFPFRHWGKTYWTCTTDGDKKPWCSTKWVFRVCNASNIYSIYLHGGQALLMIEFSGWTGLETISLETGETATLPPVCRGMTTTENLKSKSLISDKFDRLWNFYFLTE